MLKSSCISILDSYIHKISLNDGKYMETKDREKIDVTDYVTTYHHLYTY